MYTVRIFMKCTHVYQFFTKLRIEPDFSCLSGELAEQRPDMNIKATAFTVSENSINTWSGNSGQKSIQCMYFSL